MCPTRSVHPSSSECVPARVIPAPAEVLLGVSLAPMLHGATGLLDEMAPLLVVLLLISVYLWWAKSAARRQDEEDSRPPMEGEDRARKD